jgi:hypothetical protein
VASPDHPATARLTEHARLRAAEMHVETKRVKRLLRRPDVTRPSKLGRYVAVSDSDPELAVVFVKENGTLVVITVLYRQLDWYDRT